MAFWTDEADKGGAWRPAAGGKWLTLPPPPLPEWWWAAKCCWRDVSMSWRLTLWSRSRSSTVVVEAAGDAAVGASGRHSTAAIRTKHKDNGTTNQFIIFVWIPSAIKRDEIRERERATTCARAEAEGRTEGGYAAVAGAKSWGGPGSVSATRREDCLPGFVNRLWEEVACFRFVSLSLSLFPRAARVCVCAVGVSELSPKVLVFQLSGRWYRVGKGDQEEAEEKEERRLLERVLHRGGKRVNGAPCADLFLSFLKNLVSGAEYTKCLAQRRRFDNCLMAKQATINRCILVLPAVAPN